MAIYLTGDTHGDIDIHKLGARRWPEGKELTRDDYLVILGDFGLVWNNTSNERWWLSWLEGQPWTTLFIDGNHENHDRLDEMPTEEAFGAPVHFVRPHIIHLMRGYAYDLPTDDGSISVLTMGGARSIDRAFRTEGISWWSREIPSEEERERCLKTIKERNNHIDFVLTHDCPACAMEGIRLASGIRDARPDEFEKWLSNLEVVDCRRWYMGHWHIDAAIDDRHIVLYNTIEQIA